MNTIALRLKDSKEVLDTSIDTSISLKINNPIFGNDDKLSPGSFSLPFNLPSTAKNKSLMKHPTVIENNESFQIKKASLSVRGVPILDGNLHLSGFDPSKLEAYFTYGLNAISPDFKTAKLRDILDENITVSSYTMTKKVFIKVNSILDLMEITVNGTTYTGSADGIRIKINTDNEATLNTGKYMPYCTAVETGSTPSGLITAPYLEITCRQFLSTYDPISDMTFYYWNDSQDPLVDLNIVAESSPVLEVSDLSGYYDSFDAFVDPFITGTYPNDKFRFPLIFNASLHTSATKVGECINGVNSSGLIRNDERYGVLNGFPGEIRNYNSLQPFLLMKYVFEKIGTHFGFQYEGNFFEDPSFASRLIDNSATLDQPMDLLGKGKFIFWRQQFNLKELVPDITVVEFFKALQSRYNLAVYFNQFSKKVRMQHRESIAVSNDYQDITHQCSPVRKFKDERLAGIRIRIPKEEADLFSEEELFSLGSGETEYEVRCSRMFRTQNSSFDGGGVNGPYVAIENNSKLGFRIFHYRGLVSNGIFNYPAADIHAPDFSEALNDTGFLSSFKSGLYTRFWKFWIHFEQRRVKIDLTVNFPLAKILHIDFEQKLRFDRTDYLIKTLDVTISNTRYRVTSAELVTVR